MNNKIGFTTSVPVEVIYAAEKIPVDLNNIFINNIDEARKYVNQAEEIGFPRSSCGWIKGMYSIAKSTEYEALIAVIEGDCSQSHALFELWQEENINVIPFSYPHNRNEGRLEQEIDNLIKRLGTTWEKSENWKKKLDRIRSKIYHFDQLSYKKGNISGFKNHLYQVCSSDFNSDPVTFEEELDEEIYKSEINKENYDFIRLGYIGVPPIITDIYDVLEIFGGKIVYNEVQRQFSMPYKTNNLVEQYLKFTYPYDVFLRIKDINMEVKKRDLKGIIHYTQSFCYRQIQDILFNKYINVPILTIEGDSPQFSDERTKIRLESFIEMLS